MVGEEIEGAAHAAEHAQAQHIDLHELQRLDIVLVPLDDLPVVHGGGLDGDERVEAVLGQHETARVLREVARKADELACQLQGQPQTAVIQIEVELGRMFLVHAIPRSSPTPGWTAKP